MLCLRPTKSVTAFACALAILLFASPSVCRADLFDTMPDWRPIPPEEMALAAPKIDPEAGAEILLRETVVDDAPHFGSRTAFFVRIKIFDERGIEPVQNYAIDLDDSESLLYLGARVIQPDGSVTGVNSKDIIKRVVAKVGSEKITRYSFAFPGLRPGCIIECQWKSSMGGKVQSMFAMLGDEFPVHTSRLVVLGDNNRTLGYFYTNNKGSCHLKEVKKAPVGNRAARFAREPRRSLPAAQILGQSLDQHLMSHQRSRLLLDDIQQGTCPLRRRSAPRGQQSPEKEGGGACRGH